MEEVVANEDAEERRHQKEQRSQSYLAGISFEDDAAHGTQNWDALLSKALRSKGADSVALFTEECAGDD